ncbi:MAG TPA: carboxypeptidase-like regulatory domain-containing protein [Conexibacter sp.]|jgi:hypothetical protein|nr:carboxypeptidase-like regulatory domain-containing protein [Conexibacter sp.]
MTKGPQRAAGIRRGAALVLGLLLIALAAGAASASAATVSGVVRTAAGDPVPGVVLTAIKRFDPVATATTGLDGSYSLTVDSGSYQLSGALPEEADPIPGLPTQWSFNGSLSVSGDQTVNVTLPAVRTLTVHVLDSREAPQEGFTVSLPGLRAATADAPSLQAFSSVPDAVTDADGEVHGLVFDGSRPAGFRGTGSLTPPDGSGFLPSTFSVPAISGDTTLVVHAAEPSTHVTGVVRDANGDLVPGVPVSLGPASDVTDAGGAYSLGVEPGSYTFSASAPADSGALGLPDNWFLSGSLRATADRTFDVTLPQTVTLTTRVLDAEDGDAPLEGALVDLPGWDLRGVLVIDGVPNFGLNASAAQGTTDAAGEAHALLFDDAEPHFGQRVTVTPPESTGYAPVESSLPDLAGDTTVVVRAPVPFYWVTGTIRLDEGTPVADVDVDDGLDSATTGADGVYRIKVEPGGGNSLSLAQPEADGTELPPNWTFSGRFGAYADRTLDVTLPKALHVTTRILGDEDEPVPGTVISIPRFSYWFPLDTFGELTDVQARADPLTRTTDANGEAFYVEFDGTQPTFGVAARISPPVDSGYDARLFAPEFNRFDLLDVEHVHDSHAPTIAYSQSPDGALGWWSGRPASVHVTANDPRIDTLACTVDGVAPRRLGVVSGTGTLSADLTVRGEGRHPIACTATDRSDHSTSESTAALIDLTNPGASALTADRAPDYAGGGGWYADTVTVTAIDTGDPLLADGSAGSGVDPGSVPAPQTFTTSGRHVVSATVADIAGNVSRTTRLSVRVDADAPMTTLTCPARAVSLGARANASWDDDDAGSGLVGPNHGRVALDTTTLGSHTIDHTATDRVGHTTTSSCSYEVV